MSILSLVMASSLILIALGFSYGQKLKLEKEIIIGVLRAVIQLTAVGFVLKYIFALDNWIFTTILITIMVYNASSISAKRGLGINKSQYIAFLSILIGTFITMMVLVLVGSIAYIPSEAIPVSGMVIGNSMVAVGLVFGQLKQNFKERSQEVEVKLSLGASEKKASMEIIRHCVKVSMQPTVDSMKTLGIVQLPGMMTGLILAGASPLEAIKYQIMVTFMLASTVSISTFIAALMAYGKFFNDKKQLV